MKFVQYKAGAAATLFVAKSLAMVPGADGTTALFTIDGTPMRANCSDGYLNVHNPPVGQSASW